MRLARIRPPLNIFEDLERCDDDQGYKRLYFRTGASSDCIFLRSVCRVEKQRIEAARDPSTANTCTSDIAADFWMAHKPSCPCTSRRAAVNSDAVPKDFDRIIIDATLDHGTDILWDNAGHCAAVQVTADRVEKLHGRELRIVEANKAALAPDRQHAGEVRIGSRILRQKISRKR
jgi:hypothetical protein